MRARRAFGVAAIAGAATCIGVFLACNDYDAAVGAEDAALPDVSADGTTTITPDAPAIDAPSSCGGAEGCPSDCSVIYVATDGADTATGCDHSAPKKTIGGALALARSRRDVVRHIRVCNGNYDETVALDVAVSMHGSYDCNTWTRITTAGTTQLQIGTVITNPNPIVTTKTFVVCGTGQKEVVTRDVVVDGFKILGADTTSAGSFSMAANITGELMECSPTFKNNTLIAGKGVLDNQGSNGATAASVGLRLRVSSANVYQNLVQGGPGTSDETLGSVGIEISGGSPWVHDNNVVGAGANGIGSAGINIVAGSVVTGSGVAAVENNVIDGGDGTSVTGRAAAGVVIATSTAARVDLLGNLIVTGRAHVATGSSPPVSVMGVTARSRIPLRIIGNRIAVDSATDSTIAQRLLVEVTNAASLEVTNNFLAANKLGFGSSSIEAHAITIGAPTGLIVDTPLIRGNTIDVGYTATAQASDVRLSTTVRNAVIENNFLTGRQAAGAAILADTCAGGATPVVTTAQMLRSLKNNLFVASPARTVLVTNHDCPSPLPYATVPDVESAGIGAADNWEIASAADCTHARCLGDCADGGFDNTSCLRTLFESFTPPTGYDDVRDGGAWRLRTGLSCAILRGGRDLVSDAGTFADGAPFPPVVRDYYDAARTPTADFPEGGGLSFGAHEQDGICTP